MFPAISIFSWAGNCTPVKSASSSIYSGQSSCEVVTKLLRVCSLMDDMRTSTKLLVVATLLALTNLATFLLSTSFQRLARFDEEEFDYQIYDSQDFEHSYSYTGQYHRPDSLNSNPLLRFVSFRRCGEQSTQFCQG